MRTSEKLESIDCRRDDKARRVSNVDPDTVANITADTLENGVTLEALGALNVPVFRYGGQITIHGKLPAFNPSARPGGYKAVFLNGNGSVGVRYSAIDAEKKALVARACRMAGDWSANKCSTGFEVTRLFTVRDESQREAIKQQTLATLRALPVHLFFGSAYAFTLAYGAGYGAGANIGAISSIYVWPLIEKLTGIASLEALEALESAKAEADKAKHHQWEVERGVEREAEALAFKAKWEAILPTLRKLDSPIEAGEVVLLKPGYYLRAKLEKVKGRFFYTILENSSYSYCDKARKLAKNGFPWPKSLAAGTVYCLT